MAEDRSILSRPAEPGITIPYGDGPDQVVELFPPKADPRATVLVIHGGYWRQPIDRSYMRPFCHALTAAGFTAVAVEYRRTGGAGGWPRTYDDLERAVGLLDDELVFHGVDRENIILTGHSAGGHMALWGTNLDWILPDWGDPPPVHDGHAPDRLRGVVALAPVADLAEAHRLDLDDGAVQALMGDGPDAIPKEYERADPLWLPTEVPQILIHGDADTRVPIALSRDFARRAGAQLRVLPGSGHFPLVDPESSVWPTTLAAIEELAP